MNENMKKIVKSFFILAMLFNSAYAAALTPYKDPDSGFYGFKNNKGKIIITAQFQNIRNSEIDEELIPVLKNGKFYRMDYNGNLKFESVFYDNGWDYYEEGLARFIKDGKVGFHDKKGNIVINSRYDYASYFKKGFSIVCIGCWEYYPKSPKFRPLTNSILIQHEFSDIAGGKWGAIDSKGQIVVPIKYSSMKKAKKKINQS